MNIDIWCLFNFGVFDYLFPHDIKLVYIAFNLPVCEIEKHVYKRLNHLVENRIMKMFSEINLLSKTKLLNSHLLYQSFKQVMYNCEAIITGPFINECYFGDQNFISAITIIYYKEYNEMDNFIDMLKLPASCETLSNMKLYSPEICKLKSRGYMCENNMDECNHRCGGVPIKMYFELVRLKHKCIQSFIQDDYENYPYHDKLTINDNNTNDTKIMFWYGDNLQPECRDISQPKN